MPENTSEQTANFPDEDTTTLGDLVKTYGALTLQEFESCFPHPFLIQLAQLAQSPNREATFYTDLGTFSNPTEQNEALKCPVFSVVKKPDGNFPGMITVGRTPNNDIFIKYGELSKFHAYFNKKKDGWYLTDTGSTNGTHINNEALTPQQSRKIVPPLEILFGKSLSCYFLNSQAMYLYLKQYQRP